MPAHAQLQNGTVFARDFRVIEPLAEGGMGSVYVAEQLSTRRRRALKLIRPGLLSTRSAARFVQEATIGSVINSEHIVEVIGAGVDDDTGLPWLAMELLDGEDLAGVVKRRERLAPAHTLEILRQVCHAVGAAHAAGVVHRDLKPENIFVARSLRADAPFTVKVLDFGIAKVLQEAQTNSGSTDSVGSPLWMAPEQINAGRIAAATDVWALGLIAFYLLTGKVYWKAANAEGATLQAVLAEMLLAPLEDASTRAAALGCADALPVGFDAWFARCVHRDPSSRYEDAGEAFLGLSPALSTPGAAAPAPGMWSLLPSGPARKETAERSKVAINEAFLPTLDSGAARSAPLREEHRRPTRPWLVAGVAAILLTGVALGLMARRGERRDVPDNTAQARSAQVIKVVVGSESVAADQPPPPDGSASAASSATAPSSVASARVPPNPTVTGPPVPPAPMKSVGTTPPPPVPSRLQALAYLEDKADELDAQASRIESSNPQKASQLRSIANQYRSSIDNQVNSVERQALGMQASEPTEANALLQYVRDARAYFARRRGAKHP